MERKRENDKRIFTTVARRPFDQDLTVVQIVRHEGYSTSTLDRQRGNARNIGEFLSSQEQRKKDRGMWG